MLRALTLGAVAAATSAAAVLPSQLLVDPVTGLVELRNGFARLVFNPSRGSFDLWQGSFEGDGDFLRQANLAPGFNNIGPSAASLPVGLQQGAIHAVVTGDGNTLAETGTSSIPLAKPAAIAVIANSSDLAGFSVTLTDGPAGVNGPRISTSFNVTLAAASRSVQLTAQVTAVRSFTTTAVRLVMGWTPASSTTVFKNGVRQGMLMSSPYLATYSPWAWWYGMGRSGAVDITPLDDATGNYATVMVASQPWHGRRAGIDLLFTGNLPTGGWLDGFEGSQTVNVSAGTVWTARVAIAANQYDFPSSRVPVGSGGPVMDVNDQRSILTAIYGSPMGSLHSFDYYPEGAFVLS